MEVIGTLTQANFARKEVIDEGKDGIAGSHKGRRAKGIITRMKVNSQ